jgi:hypothetical protein
LAFRKNSAYISVKCWKTSTTPLARGPMPVMPQNHQYGQATEYFYTYDLAGKRHCIVCFENLSS